MNKTIKYINILASFCSRRDIEKLAPKYLKEKYNIDQADLLMLIGGSIPYGADVAARAVRDGVAKKLMIVGGQGHTTENLRQLIHAKCPNIITTGKMEADVLSEYIEYKYGIASDYLERKSTNSGNNVTYAFDVLKANSFMPKSIIVIQDSTMQQRIDACFRHHLKEKSPIKIINFAPYLVEVTMQNEKITYSNTDIWGMWDMERYITLLMGEVSRLTDDDEGYGPNGKGFIAHVDVPIKVKKAFEYLKKDYGHLIRKPV
jgi:uncharacterized SAM-binding protein YcdF (DUF218 family)